jgi:hypothetical protein
MELDRRTYLLVAVLGCVSTISLLRVTKGYGNGEYGRKGYGR